MRVKLIKNGKYSSKNNYHALIVTPNINGSIDKSYISKSKQIEVEENGYAYVNQPKQRIV